MTPEQTDVIVIGGGQAGLATSHELTARGIEHVVLERGRIGQTWRGRWESFCLVTPNWSVRLPGHPYDGPEPDGYLARDAIVAHLEGYAASFGAPVRDGVEVMRIRADDDRFLLETSAGAMAARTVVVASGSYRRPHRPGAETLSPDLVQLDVEGYHSPERLPAGPVLIVGSGQSGCQLAEELSEAGREVVLACGRAPWAPRRLDGRDVIWWALEGGFFDAPVESLPTPLARFTANVLGTGHGGGHDLNLRTLRSIGVTLAGRFLGTEGAQARFAPDLAETVAWGDDRYRELTELVRRVANDKGLPVPDIPDPAAFDPSGPSEVDVRRFGAVIFAGGFRPDYRWIEIPGVTDEMGFPVQREGASTVAPGLFFIGVHFQRKRKSALLMGVGEDAGIVAETIAGRQAG